MRIVTGNAKLIAHNLTSLPHANDISTQNRRDVTRAIRATGLARTHNAHNNALERTCGFIAAATKRHTYGVSLKTLHVTVAHPPVSPSSAASARCLVFACGYTRWGILESRLAYPTPSAPPNTTTARKALRIQWQHRSRHSEPVPPRPRTHLHPHPSSHIAGAVFTCNVASLGQDRGDTKTAGICSLFTSHPSLAAVALQETRRGSDNKPDVPAELVYLCPEIGRSEVVTKGRKKANGATPGTIPTVFKTSGIAVIARREHAPKVLHDYTDGSMLVTSLALDARGHTVKCYLCSVYVTPGDVKSTVIASIRRRLITLSAAHPYAHIYIAGDFNMRREEMGKELVTHLQRNHPSPTASVSLMQKRMLGKMGNPKQHCVHTYKNAAGSDIDHVISITPRDTTNSAAIVHSDISPTFGSDHHPVLFPLTLRLRDPYQEIITPPLTPPPPPDPITQVANAYHFRKQLQHNAADINHDDMWVRALSLTASRSAEGFNGTNWAYEFARDTLHKAMAELHAKLDVKRPPRPTTQSYPNDPLLALATSLTVTSLKRYYNRNKVKRAINLSEALCAYKCSSATKLIPAWNQSDNMRLAHLLRDIARRHLADTLLAEERKETCRRLSEAASLKTINAKKELASKQLALAGVRLSKPQPQQRDSEIGLRLELLGGGLTSTAEAAANVFVGNLGKIMRIPRVVFSHFARRRWTRLPWLTTDTLSLNIEEMGGPVQLAYESLPARLRRSHEETHDAPPLVDDLELENLNNPVNSAELRQVLVNSTNHKHAGIGGIPYEALKCMFSNQGYRLSTVREAQMRREGVPTLPAEMMSPRLTDHHHVTLRDMKMRRLVTRKNTAWSNAATRRNGLRDTLQHHMYKHARNDHSWEDNAMLVLWLDALNAAFIGARIPREWTEAEVIMLYKSGPKKNPSNYRPISLIATPQKVLHSVIAQRLLAYLDKHGMIGREQIGYLRKEETAAHVITLMEVAARRERARRAAAPTEEWYTYAIFIDIVKAFDSVPHYMLFEMLETHYGLTDETHIYNYLRELYRHAVFYVRHEGATSERKKLTCGLRQGCPLSPILFIMFINPLIIMLRSVGGVSVPAQGTRMTVSSLWYADDGVFLADSLPSAALTLYTVHSYFLSVGMRIGTEKSGLMCLFDAPLLDGNGALDTRFVKEPTSAAPSTLLFTPDASDRSSIAIPVVKSYKYLGLRVDEKLDIVAMVNARVSQYTYQKRNLYNLFKNTYLTNELKRLTLLTDYMPKTLYAPEVWGLGSPGTAPTLRKMHTDMVQLACAAVSAGKRIAQGDVAIRELGIKPIRDITVVQTWRLLEKCVYGRQRGAGIGLLQELVMHPEPCATQPRTKTRSKADTPRSRKIQAVPLSHPGSPTRTDANSDPDSMEVLSAKTAPPATATDALFSLKRVCGEIVGTARKADVARYINPYITAQADTLKHASSYPPSQESIQEYEELIASGKFAEDPHFVEITSRDHQLSTKNISQQHPTAKVLAHALLSLRDKENLAMRRKGDKVQPHRITYAHHHSIARSSVHIHRDLETMYPHLTYGFTLQSQLRCATYPLTRYKNADALPAAAVCPYCTEGGDLAEEETHDHLVFRCNAWKRERAEAAKYTKSLLAPLTPQIRVVVRTNSQNASLMLSCDKEVLRLNPVAHACATTCWQHELDRLCRQNIPPYSATSRLPHLLRSFPTIPSLTTDIQAMGTCTRPDGEKCHVDAKLELLLARRRLYSDTLNLHGHTALLTLHHTAIPGELKKLCGSSLTNLYSVHGQTQLLDVFIHVYIARFLMLIQDKRDPEAERKDYEEALSFANADSDAYKSKTTMRNVSMTAPQLPAQQRAPVSPSPAPAPVAPMPRKPPKLAKPPRPPKPRGQHGLRRTGPVLPPRPTHAPLPRKPRPSRSRW